MLLAEVAGELITAPELRIIEPLFPVNPELAARKTTSRRFSWLLIVATDAVELVLVASQTPVLPKKKPVVSVDPDATVSVSA